MKVICFTLVLFLAIACETPNRAIGNPDPITNTTGTTGSANMTNTNNGNPVSKTTPGTPTDTSVVKKDSLPR